MTCFSPLDAWQGRNGGPVFFSPSVNACRYLQIPCGQCTGCRLERSRQWAIRCMNEASCWERNCFVTLTYSDQFLPAGGTLVLADHQKFMKRLRDRLDYPPMKFYMCGEYGDQYGRPHYHYILFGIDFLDKELSHTTPAGFPVYVSALLDDIWKRGNALIGNVTFDSAAYVARYIMKKVTGKQASDAYNVYDKETGEVFHELLPEFNEMSRASGIGREFLERYCSDIYPRDKLIVNGVSCRPPRYYDNVFMSVDPLRMAVLKQQRKDAAVVRTPEELAAKEYRVKSSLANLKRNGG